MMAAGKQGAIGFILSGGEASDARDGRLSPDAIGSMKSPDGEGALFLLMDRAYEDGGTRTLAFEWGCSPYTFTYAELNRRSRISLFRPVSAYAAGIIEPHFRTSGRVREKSD
jgi:hypothetical protein